MAWYYGVNNSDLYGSNFSTVLADAPPPLDDTCDEDDNEIVFRNDINKSKKYGEKPVASPVKKTQSSEEKFTEKSKLGGSVLKGKNEHDTEEGDDFASFADFGSAFGQGNGSGESQDWFSSHDNSEKSLQSWDAKSSQPGPPTKVENDTDDDEIATLKANEESVNIQESLPNGSSHQGNSDSDWVNKSAPTNNNINGSYDLESDDDFGDFATTENAITNPGATAVKDVDSGETADKKSVAHHGDSTMDVNTKALFHDNSKKDCDILKESLSEQTNEFKTEKDTAPDVSLERFLGFVGSNRGDQESRQLDSLSAEATSSEIPTTVLADSEEGAHINSVSYKSTRIKQSTNGEQLTGKKCNTVESQNYTTLEKDTAKLSSEPSELCNSDDFGEFADFNDMPLQQSSGHNEFVQKDISPVAPEGENDEVVKGDSSFVGTASTRNKCYGDDDDDFGDFGSFEKKHGKKDDTSSDSITVDTKLTESKVKNDPFVAKASSIQDKDTDNDFGDFGAFEANHSEKEERTGSVDSEPKSLSNQYKDKDDFGGFGVFDSFNSDIREDKDQNNSIGSFSALDSEEKPIKIEGQNSDDFGDFDSFRSSAMNSQKGCDGSSANTETFGSFESNIKDSHKDNERSKDFGDFGTFESSVENSLNNGQYNDDFGGFNGNESDTKSVQKKDKNTDDFGDFGSFEANSKDSESQNKNTDDFNGDFGSFETNTKDSESHNENSDGFGDFGSFESNTKDFGQDAQSGFGDFGAFKSQDSIKKGGDDDFGDFGGFETVEERVSEQKFEGFKASSTKGKLKQNIQTNDFGAFDSKSKNLSTAKETDDDFGDFSHGKENKSGGFASFSSSNSNLTASVGASTDKNTSVKQQKTEILQHFSPSINFMIKQARDSISVCFTSELKNKFNSQCAILSSHVGKSLHR